SSRGGCRMSGSGIAWLRRGCRAGDGSRWRGDVVHGALTFQHSDLLSEREDFEGGIASLGEATAALVAAASKDGEPPDESGFARAGIDVPASTWTYQVDEEVVPAFSLAGLSFSGNLASAFAAPFVLLIAALRRLLQRTR
ncbi:MAG: hypothetical protein WCL50_08165, partial [Spirochaetota bacterium]